MNKTIKNKPDYLSKILLTWYDINKRELPWRAISRDTINPYHVLLSEFMLQQTQVSTVIPYFEKFISKWPVIEKLAVADLNEVLTMWAGLGYYRRAKNLHETAKIISYNFNGIIPNCQKTLLTFPGIGIYSSAAIIAIIFNSNSNVVDGNIERIFSRLYKINTPLKAAKNIIRNYTKIHIPKNRNGDYAQGLMDLGSTICLPRSPSCIVCPLKHICKVAEKEEAKLYPIKALKKSKPVRYGVFFCLYKKDGSILITSNNDKGLFANMDVLPSFGWYEKNNRLNFSLLKITGSMSLYGLEWLVLPEKITHIFTHFQLVCTIVINKEYTQIHNLDIKKPDRFIKNKNLNNLSLPTLMKNIIKHSQKTFLKNFNA